MFWSRVSLPANLCPMLVAVQEPEIQLILNRFQNPNQQPTALRTNVFLHERASLILECFIERSWLYDDHYLVSIACFWPKIDTVES